MKFQLLRSLQFREIVYFSPAAPFLEYEGPIKTAKGLRNGVLIPFSSMHLAGRFLDLKVF